jgi:hypothetical protein
MASQDLSCNLKPLYYLQVSLYSKFTPSCQRRRIAVGNLGWCGIICCNLTRQASRKCGKINSFCATLFWRTLPHYGAVQRLRIARDRQLNTVFNQNKNAQADRDERNNSLAVASQNPGDCSLSGQPISSTAPNTYKDKENRQNNS